MDYHSIHGHDISSFGTPSSHRLPTVAASQALEDLRNDPSTHISTGLESLDTALLGPRPLSLHSQGHQGGVKRGQVTELWGPPGTGKTAVGMQLACHALRDGCGVVWVDCFQPISEKRLAQVINTEPSKPTLESNGNSGTFTRFNCLTLPHLLALISRPNPRNIPRDVGLVVLSGATALINSALPKTHPNDVRSKFSKGPSPNIKRRQSLQSIIKALQTLALTRNCAVVILSQCATQMRPEREAVLTPAINATIWDQGVSTRIALFRDWSWRGDKSASVFLAGIQKLDGKASPDGIGHVSAFQVEATGIASVPYNIGDRPTAMTQKQHKRKLGQTDFEIPDSDDEDYGWGDDDALPPQPSQWQGSEDLILGQDVGRSDDDNAAGDDDDDDAPQSPASSIAAT